MAGAASEFGGSTNALGIQPFPHVPSNSERLSLLYRTGDDSGLSPADNGEAFNGLYPLDKQITLNEQKGFNAGVGKEWEAIEAEATAALAALAASEGTDLVSP